jgi:hypothetical protein
VVGLWLCSDISTLSCLSHTVTALPHSCRTVRTLLGQLILWSEPNQMRGGECRVLFSLLNWSESKFNPIEILASPTWTWTQNRWGSVMCSILTLSHHPHTYVTSLPPWPKKQAKYWGLLAQKLTSDTRLAYLIRTAIQDDASISGYLQFQLQKVGAPSNLFSNCQLYSALTGFCGHNPHLSVKIYCQQWHNATPPRQISIWPTSTLYW